MKLWCCPWLCFTEEEEEEEEEERKFPKPMKEGDIIFGNVVVSDDDDGDGDGNDTRGDDKQFAMVRADVLGSWPGESSSTAAAECLDIAAAGESRDLSNKRAKFYADFE